MLRMSGISAKKDKNISGERHPPHMKDIGPLSQGVRTPWGNHVDAIIVRISGSKNRAGESRLRQVAYHDTVGGP